MVFNYPKKNYITDLVKKENMADYKPTPTPMNSCLKLSKFGPGDFDNPYLYRSTMGALQYAIITKLEISFCTNTVCQFTYKLLLSH